MGTAGVADHADRASTVAALAVRRLMLRDFRNYARLDATFEAAPVVLTGDNGAGKTNLLEAVSMLAPGRGLRRARMHELDRRDGGAFSIGADIASLDGVIEVRTRHDLESERRVTEIDGGSVRRQRQLETVVGVAWLTPSLDRLFVEGPGARRRFLDRLVLSVDRAHATRVNAYERLMRERSVLLRARRTDAVWLRAVEQRMAEAAVAVAAAREQVVTSLNEVLTRVETPFPTPALRLDGEIERSLADMPALSVEQWLAGALARSRPQDAEQGGASQGPHRSDLVVVDAHTAEDAAHASTGRQKSLLISLVLAQAQLVHEIHGELPILLLDEIAAHLDERRRAQLFEALAQMRAQAWLTGTEEALFAPLRGVAQFHRVYDGTLKPL